MIEGKLIFESRKMYKIIKLHRLKILTRFEKLYWLKYEIHEMKFQWKHLVSLVLE